MDVLVRRFDNSVSGHPYQPTIGKNLFKLKNTENDIELELSVVGYQFPDDHRDNWCLVSATVKQNGNKFTVTDPALETGSLKRILEWFNHLNERILPRCALLSFTEPCLEFEFLASDAESVRVSVNLGAEMKPGFELIQFENPSEDWNIIFDLTPEDFESISEGIKLAMKQYPAR